MRTELPKSKKYNFLTMGADSISALLHNRKMALASFFTIAIFSWAAHHTYAYIAPPPLLYIPDHKQTNLLYALQKQGLPLNFLDYRLVKRYSNISKGWVRFDPKTKLTREEIIALLQDKKRESTRRIVMYAGDSIEDFATRTSKQTGIEYNKLIEQYHHYSIYEDGGIMAGYYQIPYSATASAITYYAVLISEYKFLELSNRYPDTSSDWNHILTIASIVQKETQNQKEMPLISSVIQNRLSRDMRLQLDATLNYGKYSHDIITPKRIKSDKSKFNTYLHKGLPPHPIGSASSAAITAALAPAKSNYLYFMLSIDGGHNFSSSFKEHRDNIAWYQKQKDENTTLNHQNQKGTN